MSGTRERAMRREPGIERETGIRLERAEIGHHWSAYDALGRFVGHISTIVRGDGEQRGYIAFVGPAVASTRRLPDRYPSLQAAVEGIREARTA